MSETADRVKKIVVEHLGVEAEKVTEEASFIDDLGADSLDIVELVMAFEEEFGVEIPDDAAEKIATSGAIDYIDSNRADRGPIGCRPPMRRTNGFPLQREAVCICENVNKDGPYAPRGGDRIGAGDAARRRLGNDLGEHPRRQVGRGDDHPVRCQRSNAASPASVKPADQNMVRSRQARRPQGPASGRSVHYLRDRRCWAGNRGRGPIGNGRGDAVSRRLLDRLRHRRTSGNRERIVWSPPKSPGGSPALRPCRLINLISARFRSNMG